MLRLCSLLALAAASAAALQYPVWLPGYNETNPMPEFSAVMYKQCGQSWSNDELGTCSGTTICDAGCAMCSVDMYLAYRGCSPGNPGAFNTWLKSHGGYASGCNIVWGSVGSCVSFQGAETPSYETACSGINAGHGLILNVHDGGHYVLATGCDGANNYFVNDPGYSTTKYAHSSVVKMDVYH
eukprot:TRINITY_DN2359_c0_g1_i1.p1 TRINITY_DN2359_c0_g1~~TRINITY_DN2359_c0_g1_i1.p1  ORF type:complete len:183 (+),score=50.40 TRINITY_DN2359_c0_g1_i1:82-630(+)